MPQISLNEEAQADTDSAIDWYIGEGGMRKARRFPSMVFLIP